jgi:hypothetical protein
MHLTQAAVHLLEALGHLLERGAEALLERRLQLLVDRRAHLLELLRVLHAQQVEALLDRLAERLDARLPGLRQLRQPLGERLELLLLQRAHACELLRGPLLLARDGRGELVRQLRQALAEGLELVRLRSRRGVVQLRIRLGETRHHVTHFLPQREARRRRLGPRRGEVGAHVALVIGHVTRERLQASAKLRRPTRRLVAAAPEAGDAHQGGNRNRDLNDECDDDGNQQRFVHAGRV